MRLLDRLLLTRDERELLRQLDETLEHLARYDREDPLYVRRDREAREAAIRRRERVP